MMASKNTMGLEKVDIFPPRGVRKIASKHLRVFVNRVTEKGRDKEDRPFKAYTKKYREIKSRDYRRKKDGKRYKGFEGISLSNQVGKPNFQLTHKTMRNLKRKGDIRKDQYTLGWSGEAASIVRGNAERGRNIIGVPDKEMNLIVKWFADLWGQEVKLKVKDTTVYVGSNR